MSRIRTLVALMLLVVLGIAATTWSVVSPYGRYGLARTETTDDHPWGGNAHYTEPIGGSGSSGTSGVVKKFYSFNPVLTLILHHLILPDLQQPSQDGTLDNNVVPQSLDPGTSTPSTSGNSAAKGN